MRGRPKEFDRDLVLGEAMRLFWQKGYESTSMSDLSACMGIGRQSIYDTFGDKKALFLESLKSYCLMQFGQLRSFLEGPGSPLENLRKMFHWIREQVLQKDFPGCMVVNAAGEMGLRDAEIAAMLQHQSETLRDMLRRTLVRAVEAGELPAETNTDDLSAVLLSSFLGMTVLGKIGLGADLVDQSVQSTLSLLE